MSKQIMCECEHESHFDHDVKPRKLSPNGNPNHKYGQMFFERYTKDVSSIFGVQTVCLNCANDCCVAEQKECR